MFRQKVLLVHAWQKTQMLFYAACSCGPVWMKVYLQFCPPADRFLRVQRPQVWKSELRPMQGFDTRGPQARRLQPPADRGLHSKIQKAPSNLSWWLPAAGGWPGHARQNYQSSGIAECWGLHKSESA